MVFSLKSVHLEPLDPLEETVQKWGNLGFTPSSCFILTAFFLKNILFYRPKRLWPFHRHLFRSLSSCAANGRFRLSGWANRAAAGGPGLGFCTENLGVLLKRGHSWRGGVDLFFFVLFFCFGLVCFILFCFFVLFWFVFFWFIRDILLKGFA